MSQSPQTAPQAGALPGAAADPFTAAAEQTQHLMKASMKTWVEESRAFAEDLARDSSEALQELQTCKSPLDMIVVEQKWLMARTQAYIDAGVRLISGVFELPEEAAAEAASVRLPE